MSASEIYRASSRDEYLRQGEIVSNLVQAHLELPITINRQSNIIYKSHPYAVIISQDCDLEQDGKSRFSQSTVDETKKIPNVLFCEMVTADVARSQPDLNSKLWSNIQINKNERYHFFQKIEIADDLSGDGLPELCVDFKRYFTIPADEVYDRLKNGDASRRCVLKSPYLEHLSSRFAYFLSRIALPLDHVSD